MTTGRCMKCKVNREIKDPVHGVNARGTAFVTGICPVCGTKMYRFVSKKKGGEDVSGGCCPYATGGEDVSGGAQKSHKRTKAKAKKHTK